MDNKFTLKQIGTIRNDGYGFRLELNPQYRPALVGMDGFSYINIIWWFSSCDDNISRATLTVEKPYTNGPDTLGTFSTRSPQRPNPIALSCAYVTFVDMEKGVLGLAYIDAEDNSPVLDIKPYTPSLDRVETPHSPQWCAHWPRNIETSGDFNWEDEFNF